jgi:glycosyltransferase involved in cell wall biosynthesis
MTDVLIVSLGATGGLRTADRELERAMRVAGADVALTEVPPPASARDRRWLPALVREDHRWARSARGVARDGIERLRPRAIVYSTTTAALLWPEPGAIRFDTCAHFNRPGPIGFWQRPLERRRFASAPLLLPWSDEGLEKAPAPRTPTLVVPVPVEPSGPPAPARDITAITYANLPYKKGLDRVLAAWREVRLADERLVVAGAEGVPAEAGVESTGRLPADEFRALLRRARAFVTAPRREDYGIVQLEALADGCMLVTTPAAGPYVAYGAASRIDPRLTGPDLGAALRAALDDPRPDYAERALAELEPFRRATVDALVEEELLPRLLGGS